ncbi:MAG: DUF2157 domain-containing protein [Sphingobacteriales bacterium]|nr:MAG: DUF2157 domain-containing protein [Sphingobacteriales bacterium]
MEIDNQEYKTINEAIDTWLREGKLNTGQAEELRASFTLRQPAQQIARYFFLIALSCTLMAFGAIFIDEKFLEKVRRYFDLSHYAIAFIMAALSVSWFVYIKRKKSMIRNVAYEIYLVLGALSGICALVYICKETGFGETYSGFLAGVLIMLVGLSIYFQSRALWIGALAAGLGLFGSISYNLSQDHLFLGMNYPMQFTLFGAVILGLSFLHRVIPEFARRLTFIAGIIIFFVSLWGVSIFGNYSDLDLWFSIRQTRVLAYAFVFGAASLIALYLGIKHKDETARDLGVLFLLINFYSRYFEYFWDAMHKGLFFLFLAVSFYFVGKWLEKHRKKRKLQ